MGLILTKIKTIYNNFFDDGRISEDEIEKEMERWRHQYYNQLIYDYASEYGGERVNKDTDIDMKYYNELR